MTPKSPIFLARAAYRLRRAMDAARVLPIVGGGLFLMPLIWTAGSTRQGIIYIFAIWIGLIIAAALLSRILIKEPQSENHGATDLGQDSGSV